MCAAVLYTFGCGALGELGHSRIEEGCRQEATVVHFPPIRSQQDRGEEAAVVAVALGTDHSIALVEGRPFRWGLLSAPPAKLSPTSASSGPAAGAVLSPAPLVEWYGGGAGCAAEDLDGMVCAVASGGSNSFLLTREGTVFVLGDLRPPGGPPSLLRCIWGKLHADPGPGGSLTPRPRVAQISAGWRHCLLLVEGGSVHAVGDDEHGQCAGVGDGRCALPLPSLEPILGIAAGACHSVAWDTNGVAFAWGHGGNGRLGLGSSRNRSSPTPVEQLTEPVCMASCGANFSVFVTDGGFGVWACGGNQYGQLGLGNLDLDVTSSEYPLQIDFLRGGRVVALDCGVNHTLCLSRRGGPAMVSERAIVWAWGCSTSGQCGRAEGELRAATPPQCRRAPLPLDDFLAPLPRWPVVVAAGRFHSAVIACAAPNTRPCARTRATGSQPRSATFASFEPVVEVASSAMEASWEALANLVVPSPVTDWEPQCSSTEIQCESSCFQGEEQQQSPLEDALTVKPSAFRGDTEEDVINMFCDSISCGALQPLSIPTSFGPSQFTANSTSGGSGHSGSASLLHWNDGLNLASARAPAQFQFLPPRRPLVSQNFVPPQQMLATPKALRRASSTPMIPLASLVELGEEELQNSWGIQEYGGRLLRQERPSHTDPVVCSQTCYNSSTRGRDGYLNQQRPAQQGRPKLLTSSSKYRWPVAPLSQNSRGNPKPMNSSSGFIRCQSDVDLGRGPHTTQHGELGRSSVRQRQWEVSNDRWRHERTFPCFTQERESFAGRSHPQQREICSGSMRAPVYWDDENEEDHDIHHRMDHRQIGKSERPNLTSYLEISPVKNASEEDGSTLSLSGLVSRGCPQTNWLDVSRSHLGEVRRLGVVQQPFNSGSPCSHQLASVPRLYGLQEAMRCSEGSEAQSSVRDKWSVVKNALDDMSSMVEGMSRRTCDDDRDIGDPKLLDLPISQKLSVGALEYSCCGRCVCSASASVAPQRECSLPKVNKSTSISPERNASSETTLKQKSSKPVTHEHSKESQSIVPVNSLPSEASVSHNTSESPQVPESVQGRIELWEQRHSRSASGSCEPSEKRVDGMLKGRVEQPQPPLKSVSPKQASIPNGIQGSQTVSEKAPFTLSNSSTPAKPRTLPADVIEVAESPRQQHAAPSKAGATIDDSRSDSDDGYVFDDLAPSPSQREIVLARPSSAHQASSVQQRDVSQTSPISIASDTIGPAEALSMTPSDKQMPQSPRPKAMESAPHVGQSFSDGSDSDSSATPHGMVVRERDSKGSYFSPASNTSGLQQRHDDEDAREKERSAITGSPANAIVTKRASIMTDSESSSSDDSSSSRSRINANAVKSALPTASKVGASGDSDDSSDESVNDAAHSRTVTTRMLNTDAALASDSDDGSDSDKNAHQKIAQPSVGPAIIIGDADGSSGDDSDAAPRAAPKAIVAAKLSASVSALPQRLPSAHSPSANATSASSDFGLGAIDTSSVAHSSSKPAAEASQLRAFSDDDLSEIEA